MNIIVFLNAGNTLIFGNVSNLRVLNKCLIFDYEGKVTGTKNTATFLNFAGYSELDENDV